MTYPEPSRFKRLSPSLLVVGMLFFAAACASAPPRPPAPISTGDPRQDPDGRPFDLSENGENEFGQKDIEFGEDINDATDNDGFTPPHMAGRDIKRAAVLLPFSHPSARVRADAESLLAGIELALFNRGEENFVILPKDTAGRRSTAAARAEEALEEGADLIIGPLFSANIQEVRSLAYPQNVPVIGFSSQNEAAGQGAYLISVAPEEEISRVVDVAASRGAISYAFLGPNNDYGRRVEAALRFAAARNGGSVVSSAFYNPENDAPVDEAQQVARALKSLGTRPEGEIAVMIPEAGVKLRAVAPLLPYYGVDIRRVQMMGTGRWNDESIWREPTLAGGIFAAPDPESLERFEENFTRIYGTAPTPLTSIGYDSGAMAAALASADALTVEGITTPDGFTGVNGLFRFRLNGTAERSLSVLEIDPGEGAVLVELGAETFDPPVF